MDKLTKTPSIPQKPASPDLNSTRRFSFIGQAFSHPPKIVDSELSLPEQSPSIDLSRSALEESSSQDVRLTGRVYSDLATSTAIASSESSSPDLEELKEKKEWYALVWLDIQLALAITSIFLQGVYYNDHSAEGKIIILIQAAFTLFQAVLIVRSHWKENRALLWLPLVLLQLSYLGIEVYHWKDQSAILNEDASAEAQELISIILSSQSHFEIIAFFQNAYIILYFLESFRQRRAALFFVSISIFVIQLLSFHDLAFPEQFLSFNGTFILLALFNVLLLNFLFLASAFNLQRIQQALFRLKNEENRKLKSMFNSIQDGVILLEGLEPSFINSLALKIFSEGDESGNHSLSVMDSALFFPFHTSTEAKGLFEPGTAHTLCDLMSYEPISVQEATFTTSKGISECQRMDQVQRIIEKDDENKAKFYQIRFIKVLKAEKTMSHTDEVMVQISDISARIQSQYMKLERQYLTLMNSTVSHEMRNPLNAMVSQNMQQQKLLNQFEGVIGGMSCCLKAEAQALIKQSHHCLRVALSSTKLLRFNVEDILALPQLKQGRFTKNFSMTSLKRMVEEVTQIMDFQAKEKGVDVTVEYDGFFETTEGQILINLDEQRFQQVLLNYLSNGLKFTDRKGAILILLSYVAATDVSSESDIFQTWNSKARSFWESKAGSNSQRFCSESFSDESSDSGSKMSQDQINEYVHLQQEATRAIFAPELSPKLVVSVIDTGIGIKVEEQTRLFKLFGTIKRTRAVNTRGVGLGLSISKMICEEFGGSVSLKSQEGVGSAFLGSFILDEVIGESPTSVRGLQNLAQPSPPLRSQLQKQASGSSSQSLVYIVDDEAYNCEVLKVMVRSIGIPETRMRTFMSGTQALKSIHEELHDPAAEIGAILTDLSMPVMDGYQLITRIKKVYESRGKPAPIIAALTGHTESDFIRKAYEQGANYVYSKPISLEQVQQVLLEAGVKE